MENNKKVYIGIDVSKDFLDATDGINHCKITNDKKSIDKFLRKYKHQQVYVCAEFTGPYHNTLADVCFKKKITLFLCDGFKVLHAKKAMGYRSKTDKGDADFLREYSLKNDLKPYVVPKNLAKIKELVNLQDLEINHLRRLKTHKDAIFTADAAKALKKEIDRTEENIKNLQKKINHLVEEDEALVEKKDILQAVHGIGEKIATRLIISLPELGSLNRRQVAALCGLAPYNNESGKYKGHRTIKGGRSRVREALYLAALASVREGSFYWAAYKKMVDDQNRPKKVALIMVARKMACYLNSLMKRVIVA